MHYLFDADDDGSNASGDELYVYFQSKNFYRPSGRILDTVVDIADPKEPKQPARAEGAWNTAMFPIAISLAAATCSG